MVDSFSINLSCFDTTELENIQCIYSLIDNVGVIRNDPPRNTTLFYFYYLVTFYVLIQFNRPI